MRPVFSSDMYDAVPAISKGISEQNTITKNRYYKRLNATLQQQTDESDKRLNELLQQVKDKSDRANVLIEEKKMSIYTLKK